MSALAVIAWLVAGPGSAGQIIVEESASSEEGALENRHSSTDIINDVHLTLEIDLEAGLMRDRWLVEVWWKGPDKFRAEVLETSFPNLRGLTIVMNGDRAWLYNPDGHEVIEGESGDVKLPLVQDMISATVERAPVDKIEYPGRGTVTVQASEFNTGLTDRLFALDVPADVQWTFAPGTGPRALTLAEAREAVDFPVLMPTYIPKRAALSGVFRLSCSAAVAPRQNETGDFAETSTSLRRECSGERSVESLNGDVLIQPGEKVVIALHYDGPMPFTIVQGWNEALGPIPRAVRAGLSTVTSLRGVEGIFIADERQSGVFLTWVEDGVRISIAGHLSLEEAIAIAESLGP